jgi:hypothetical protein
MGALHKAVDFTVGATQKAIQTEPFCFKNIFKNN